MKNIAIFWVFAQKVADVPKIELYYLIIISKEYLYKSCFLV